MGNQNLISVYNNIKVPTSNICIFMYVFFVPIVLYKKDGNPS